MYFKFCAIEILDNIMTKIITSVIYHLLLVPPMIWIQNQLVGAGEGKQMTLECHSEAYPKSINYWTREKGEIISHG